MTNYDESPFSPETEQFITKQQWDEMAAFVETITDDAGKPIDEGIKETVVVLNLLGFPTVSSCEGHLIEGINHASPMVDINLPDDEALVSEQRRVLAGFNQAVETGNEEEIRAYWEACNRLGNDAFRPLMKLGYRLVTLLDEFYGDKSVSTKQRLMIIPGVAGLTLESQNAMLLIAVDEQERAKELNANQQHMREFTEFLKHKFFED